jgi:hypothetical protein
MKQNTNNRQKAFVAAVIAMTLLVSCSAAVANSETMRTMDDVEQYSTEPMDPVAGLGYTALQWDVTFGGVDNDWGRSAQQTTDGGYILTGDLRINESTFDSNLWLVKTNASGTEEWSTNYGGANYDSGYSVQQTTDGGYIVAGITQSYGAGGEDFWLVKTDASGTEEWNSTFGGIGFDRVHTVEQTMDGGYILIGVTNSYGAGGLDAWLVKTDANGTEEWNATYGGDECYGGQQTSDGGYILVGSSGGSIWLVKTNASGTEEWNAAYGGSMLGDCGNAVDQTADGGYIIAAQHNMFPPVFDLVPVLIKTDASGTEEWSITYSLYLGYHLFSVQQTTDGGYVFAGNTPSSGDCNVWAFKTDASGSEEWSMDFGGVGSDMGCSVQQTADGYIIAGYTHSYGAGELDAWLIKLADYYTLATTIEGSGIVALDPAGGTYLKGTTVNLTAYAAHLWEFSHWSGDATGSDNPLSITMGSDKDITAHFVETEYTLTIQVEGAGTVVKDPDQSTYAPGTEVELTANENPGWIFTHWAGDLTGSDNPATITITDNKTVVAYFKAVPELAIGDITGGLFKIQAALFNDGFGDALDVDWNITVTPTRGVIFLGGETTGAVLRIPAMGETAVKSDAVFGIGKVDVTVSASTETSTDLKTVTGTVLGFYIII